MEKWQELFEETYLTYKDISEKTGLSIKQLHSRIHAKYPKSYINKRKETTYRNSDRSNVNHRTSDEPFSDGKGYLKVYKDGRQTFVHHTEFLDKFVWDKLPTGLVVHHIDGDTTNNELDNLAICTIAGHRRIHSRESATTIPGGSTAKRSEAVGPDNIG